MSKRRHPPRADGRRFTHAQRITNGQRAAVCGLMIVGGLTLTDACMIVGAPFKSMANLLPDDWRKKVNPTKKRWFPHMLVELEEAWLDPAQKLATIAERYGVGKRAIADVAFKQGWRTRRAVRQIAARRRPEPEAARWTRP